VQHILENYAVNDLRADTDNISTRFSDILTVAENVAKEMSQSDTVINYISTGEGNNPLSGFVSSLPQIEEIRIYYENGLAFTDSSYISVTDDIKNLSWYKRAKTDGVPFWNIISVPSEEAEEEEKYYLALIEPLTAKTGETAVAAVIVSPTAYQTAVSPINYPVTFTMSNGVVIYSSSDFRGILDSMYVPLYENDEASVLQDNFFYGSDYTVTVPFSTGFTNTEFRIYLTVPYTDLTEESRNVTLIYIWYVGLCLILSILISILLTGFFTRRINFLKRQMNKVTGGDLELSDEIKGEDEIYELYGLLKQMVNSIMFSNTETTEAKLQAETFRLNQVEAEFKALASQINPHFLYNTLETIRMKAYSNDDRETAELLKVLGKFMRRSLSVKDGLVNLETEIEFTHNYLKLQAARFGDRVTYNIYCEPSGEYMILPLIIQPLVENAYAHGVEKVKQGGYILIAVKYAGKDVIIEVTDNGGGMDKQTLTSLREKIENGDTSSGKSIGLTNVHMRIKKYFGNEYGMKIFSELGKGTTIRLTLPRETGTETEE
ncbi:MAG: sensor histidine kinase, partial [Ruminococcus sp.]|nr:sensor histidine kinase [Ruminococcus sp.]